MKLMANKRDCLLSPKLALCLIACSTIHSANAEVVFDGSIGSLPAGTLRSGDFVIAESDGQLSGTNLFHSFERFNVNTGESATFSHTTPNVFNIISRVTGDTGTLIQGQLNVGGELGPSLASLWLINPNGIVIGEGAALTAGAGFRFSSANEIGFDNGDAFFSHDITNNSTLSVATPTSFGFLSGNPLPDSVTPGPVILERQNNSRTAATVVNDLALVGANVDPNATGLRIGSASPDQETSTFLRNIRLFLHALGPGGTVSITPAFAPGDIDTITAGSGVEINSTRFDVSDQGNPIPPAPTLVTGENVAIRNSGLFTSTLSIPNALAIHSNNQTSITGSTLQTATVSSVDAGDLLITGNSIISNNSFIFSNPLLPENSLPPQVFGSPGNISLMSLENGTTIVNPVIATNSSRLGASSNIVITSAGDISIEGTTPLQFIFTVNASDESGGDITIGAAGDLSINSTLSITTSTFSSGSSGDILLTGESVSLDGITSAASPFFVGDPLLDRGLNLIAGAFRNSDLPDSPEFSGNAGEVRIVSNQDLDITNTVLSSGSFNGRGSAGAVSIEGDDLTLNSSTIGTRTNSANPLNPPGSVELIARGDLATRSVAISGTGSDQAPAGTIAIVSDGSVLLSNTGIESVADASGRAGEISINAGGSLTIEGNLFIPGNLTNEDRQAFLSTDNRANGDGGDILLVAQDITLRDNYGLRTEAALGDAGNITLRADRIFGGSGFITTASSNGGGGNINLLANELRLTGSADGGSSYFANSFSSGSDGDGGSITLGDAANPADLILINRSFFTAAADQGDGGRINVNANTFIASATSSFGVASNSGTDGVLIINAPQQDISASVVELAVPTLDQTDLIQDVCSKSIESRSSLVVTNDNGKRDAPDSYFSGFNQQSGPPDSSKTDLRNAPRLGCAQ